MEETKRISYLEYLRILSTLAVIIIHVAIGLTNNYSIEELGILPSAVLNSTYLLVNWAVPCFLMISGTLLLDPNRKINEKKIFQYVLRMALILLIFGWGFAFMEELFIERYISIKVITKSFFNMLSRKSWGHMWYIYTLIGLYLVTIPLRCIVKYMERKILRNFLFILIIGNFIIRSINVTFLIEIDNYMQMGEYISYYLLGYYVASVQWNRVTNIPKYSFLFIAVLISGFKFAVNWLWIISYGQNCSFVYSANILTLVQVISVFLAMKEYCNRKDLKITKTVNSVSRCSFTIYLIHPFFENLLYKVIGFTPLSLSDSGGIGIIVFTIILFVLSWIVSLVLIRIPFIKRIL